ncbi:MAG: hypothetical protein KC931_15320 [Candidatus Omnitrophica bacterium]|nr:hypothetical protein [Candidatus Omnitrophota bacterium]MCB9767441.1 hypothetical protein [Candidatus Omnitrophota bacterium]
MSDSESRFKWMSGGLILPGALILYGVLMVVYGVKLFGSNQTITEFLHVCQSTANQPTYSGDSIAIFSDTATTARRAEISIVSGNNNSAILNFGDQNDENVGYIEYNHASNSFKIYTNGSANPVLTIDSSGNVSVSGNITVTGDITAAGNVTATNGNITAGGTCCGQ